MSCFVRFACADVLYQVFFNRHSLLAAYTWHAFSNGNPRTIKKEETADACDEYVCTCDIYAVVSVNLLFSLLRTSHFALRTFKDMVDAFARASHVRRKSRDGRDCLTVISPQRLVECIRRKFVPLALSANHSTAQHITAHHSTAEHSTGHTFCKCEPPTVCMFVVIAEHSRCILQNRTPIKGSASKTCSVCSTGRTRKVARERSLCGGRQGID